MLYRLGVRKKRLLALGLESLKPRQGHLSHPHWCKYHLLQFNVMDSISIICRTIVCFSIEPRPQLYCSPSCSSILLLDI